MIHSLQYILWFFLPAILANMTPVMVHYFNLTPALYKPLDGGFSLQGKRIFGEHKTVRGLFWGTIVGSLVGWLQAGFSANGAVLGALLGFGALFGDATKSFIKRRWSFVPGESWPPFDQIDFVLGAALFMWPWRVLTLPDIFLACVLIGIGSYIISVTAFFVGLKKEI